MIVGCASLLAALAVAASAPAAQMGGVAKGMVDPEGKAQPVPAAAPAPSPTPIPGVSGDDSGGVVKDMVAGGTHWRVGTDKGPIHVWRPPGFDLKTAGVLVYLHGYYTNVDESWTHHHLAEQFRASRRNALFVVPEVPVGINDRVRWVDPEAIFEVLRRDLGLEIPAGAIAVMGHSGAFRTVLGWLSCPRLEQIILLDGLYNCEADFLAWLKSDPKPPSGRRMVIVGFETAERSEAFLPNVAEALFRDGIPESGARFKRRERLAKLLYVHSQYDHMGLITEGKAIPVLMRLTGFKAL